MQRYTANDYNRVRPDRGDPAITTIFERLLYAAIVFSTATLSALGMITLCRMISP
jgi:hypothetical protein